MKLNQLADQLHAKTIGLIAIAKALEYADLPNPHGGTPLNPEQAQQITAVFRYHARSPDCRAEECDRPDADDGCCGHRRNCRMPKSVRS